MSSEDEKAIWFLDLAWSTLYGMCALEPDLETVSSRVTHSIQRARKIMQSVCLLQLSCMYLFLSSNYSKSQPHFGILDLKADSESHAVC